MRCAIAASAGCDDDGGTGFGEVRSAESGEFHCSLRGMERTCETAADHNKAVAEFVCNICGGKNSYSGEPFDRETPGCRSCGSNLRTRALIGALSMELFGIQLSLADFPRVKSWRGLGTSDSREYAKRLAEVFDYRNTFYDREPRLRPGKTRSGRPNAAPNQYDFRVVERGHRARASAHSRGVPERLQPSEA